MASQFRGRSPATAEATARAMRRTLRESYPDISPQSSLKGAPKPDECKTPLTGHDMLWLSDAVVVSCAVDAAEWPAWTDDVAFGIGRKGGAR